MATKRILCILIAAMCAVCLAACSSGGADASASTDASEPANFSSWTKDDWDKATSDQKYEAAADLIRMVQEPQMSLTEFVEEAKNDPGIDAEVIEVEGLIEAAFSSQEGITLGDADIDVSSMMQDTGA